MYRWEEIYLELKDKIENNIYKSDTFLPTEYQLCIKYKVSRETIRKIYSKLETENYILSIKNKGRVIRRKDVDSNLLSFRDLTKNKYKSEYKIVFSNDTKIEIIVKRYDENIIYIFEKSKIYKKYVDTSFMTDELLNSVGILNYLKKYSYNKINNATKRFVVSIDSEAIKETKSNFCILNDCLIFDIENNVIEHSKNYYNPNYFEYYLFEKYNN